MTRPREGGPPSVSIIIAAYNAEQELGLLLESLCASEYTDFEVCIRDDGSTDRTGDTIRAFDERLCIRSSTARSNAGVTNARNEAAQLARGPLLLFLDADVRVYPDTIGRLKERLETMAADVVVGIYSDVALDDAPLSRYYALFVHHSFLIAEEPVAYNVFNAWCALCRREAWEETGGHVVVPKGVEVENETTGRRMAARGFKLLLDPSIAVDHHWGGHRKMRFIFLHRVYWWVKIFFATGFQFESSLTTRGYGMATLCAPGVVLSALLGVAFPPIWAATPWLLAGFLWGYMPFYAFTRRRRGLAYTLGAAGLSLYFALYAAASAALSASEEVLRRVFTGRYTLDPTLFKDQARAIEERAPKEAPKRTSS